MSDYKQCRNVEYLDESIERKDWRLLREQLCVSCKMDHAFATSEFEDGIEYVLTQKHVDKTTLYEPYDHDEKWMYAARVDAKDTTLTDDDFSDAVFSLGKNFCRERIEDVKKLGSYLESCKKKVQPQQQITKTPEPAVSAKKAQASNPSKRPAQPQNRTGLMIAVGIAGAAVIVMCAILLSLSK